MTRSASAVTSLAVACLLASCASLEPRMPVADAGIPTQWPAADAPATPAVPTSSVTADPDGRDFFADPRLQSLLSRALDNNRDLRVAVARVERARAQYRIQRAERLPAVELGVALDRSGGDDRVVQDSYSANLGLAQFELDLFGRVRNLSQSALQQFLATDATRHSAQLSLVAEVANSWLTLAADRELQAIAEDALASREASFKLTESRHRLGAISALDVHQERTVVETARADVARYAGQVALDRNALVLLAGAPVEEALLPERLTGQSIGIAALPPGVPSDVLLRRPDVRQAEHLLRAANADIGAARAAFFPAIRLTGGIDTASDSLSGLFDGGSVGWNFSPRLNLPIFQGGRLRAGLGVAKADRDIALAAYERAIQSGFREAADGLALSQSLARQREAREALLAAATSAEQLSAARYKAGRDSYLVLLDAQRTRYGAQQALVSTRLAEQANRVTLYKALGGGWKGQEP